MTAKEYQQWVPSVNGDNLTSLLSRVNQLGSSINLGDVILASMGLPGEIGEVVDLLKKWVFHGKTLDIEHLKKEMGDVMWYFTLLANSFGFTLEEVMQMNADKLNARFPNGFNYHDANNRKPGDI